MREERPTRFAILRPHDVRNPTDRAAQPRALPSQGGGLPRRRNRSKLLYDPDPGEAEILRQEGTTEKRLTVGSAGDSFGDVALPKDMPRTATVRCLTPVNVVMFSRSDFNALVGNRTRHQPESCAMAAVKAGHAVLPGEKSVRRRRTTLLPRPGAKCTPDPEQ